MLKVMKRSKIPEYEMRAGFTLIELLVVVAVVSVLSAMSLGAVTGLRQIIGERESWIRFTELTQAVRMYQIESGEWPAWLQSGEAEIGNSSDWQDALVDYYEGPFLRSQIADGFGNQRIYMVADLDGDNWIRADEFEQLAEEQRPQRLHAKVIVYSLDPEGRLAASTW